MLLLLLLLVSLLQPLTTAFIITSPGAGARTSTTSRGGTSPPLRVTSETNDFGSFWDALADVLPEDAGRRKLLNLCISTKFEAMSAQLEAAVKERDLRLEAAVKERDLKLEACDLKLEAAAKERDLKLEARDAQLEAVVMKLQDSNTQLLQARGTYDVRGYLEYVERDYCGKLEVRKEKTPKGPEFRKQLWQLYVDDTLNKEVIDRIKNECGCKPDKIPAMMDALFRHLSGYLHDRNPSEVWLPRDGLNSEQKCVIKCLARHSKTPVKEEVLDQPLRGQKEEHASLPSS